MHCGKRVEEYRLQDIKGFDQLPDEELHKISRYISNHWTANGQNYVGGHLRSLGLRIQGRRIRESIGRVHPQNTALRWGGGGGCFSSNLPSSMAKFTVALGWPSFIDKVENCHAWVHRWILQANYFPKKKLKQCSWHGSWSFSGCTKRWKGSGVWCNGAS